MIVIQARMGSSRLPGKVLRSVADTTILDLMLDRLQRADLAPVVVATSDRGIDDPIADRMAERDEDLFRGSESYVLQRLSQAARTSGDSSVVRLTADCPLIDPEVVAEVMSTHARTGADYTSNTLHRTFPDGLDVEVIETEALYEADACASDPIEREHVTPHIVRRPETYTLAGHIGPVDAEDERWTIDDEDDFTWLEGLLRSDPELKTAAWQEVLAQVGYARNPGPGELVLRVVRGDSPTPPPDATHLGARSPSTPAPDGSAREWIASRDDRVVGHLTVEVHRGCGLLTGWLDTSVDPGEALDALEHRLSADLQVVELRCHPAGADQHGPFAARGYDLVHGIATRVRIPPVLTQAGAIT